ncbi:hypothetical protein PHMEG_00026285 [Phytophthora megakarya]|uniref:Uncharacterized protein n=1 Tax=Phytophthora megakarya TaxID=4795 RepID=A0A225V9Y8_9STRA|nr:hypothetical protein PHMEG_00026285 [Phytophthora megakarya]
MAPNCNKVTPANLGKIAFSAHTDAGPHLRQLPSSSDESDGPAPDTTNKGKLPGEESSSGESDAEDDTLKNVPRVTKSPAVKKPSSKRASRTLNMSEMKRMRDDLEENQAKKGKRTGPMSMTFSPASTTTLAFARTGEARLVGIPATREHLKSDAFVQDGYGGLEALIQMESLGLRELASLADYVVEGEDSYDYILTPRETPLLDGEFDEVVKSVQFQREIASVLTEFIPDEFSQRVFGTGSVLRKVTSETITLSRQLAVANQTTQDRIQKIDEDHDFRAGKHRADLQKYLAEARANLHGLQAQNFSLQAQLQAVNAQSDASQRPRMDVDGTMNFLDTNSQLSLQDGDEEQKESDRPQDLPLGSFLDLTRDFESDPSKSSGKRKRSSKSPWKTNKHSQSGTPMNILLDGYVTLVRLVVLMGTSCLEPSMLRVRC